MTAIRKTLLGAIGLAGLGLIVMAAEPAPSSVTAAGVTLSSVSVIMPGSRPGLPERPRCDADQCELPHMPFRRHGAKPAKPYQTCLAGCGYADDHAIPGADRHGRHPADRL